MNHSTTRKTRKTPTQEQEEDFKRFWNAYPRKQDRAKALRAFTKLAPDADLLAVILDAVSWQAKTEQWQKSDGQFVPLPASWLNGERWKDEKPPDKLQSGQYHFKN